MKNDITAGELCNRIAAAHPSPEWACFFEVSDAAGFNRRRSADAIAMNLWPSRGLTIRGFEIKVDRADLKKERENPEKAEAISKYCDEWWLVTPEGLVRDVGLELPPSWGLMEARGSGLKTIRAVTRKDSEPPTKGFLAAALRRASEMVARENNGWVRREDIQDKIDKAFESGKSMIPMEVQQLKDRADKLQKRLDEFREGTGIDLAGSDWHVDVKRISHTYKVGVAIDGEYGHNIKSLASLFNALESQVKEMRGNMEKLQEGMKP